MKYSNKEIIDYIKEFSKYGKQVKECFSLNNCYWFAIILKEKFDGDIMFNEMENHFSCRVNKKLYDITGCCDNLYYNSWEKWENYKIGISASKLNKLCKEFNI